MNKLTISTIPLANTTSNLAELTATCTALWNDACGDEFAVSNRTLAWAFQSTPDRESLLFLASQAEQPIGFLLASYSTTGTMTVIDALAVIPTMQQRGVGRSLLAALQTFVETNNSRTLQVGGAPFSLMPGVPEIASARRFFAQTGFQASGTIIAHTSINVATYQPPPTLNEIPATIYPAQAGQQTVILDFLQQHPSPAIQSMLHFVQKGRRLSDLMLLWTEAGLAGICQLGFEDSPLPIELSFPYRLPRPWAQIGPILLQPNGADDYRAALLDASLRRLHNNGVNSAVVTSQLSTMINQQFQLQPYHSFYS